MTRLLILALGITTGVVIALSLCRKEPVAAPLYREDDDGIQPWDPRLWQTDITWTEA